MARKRKKTAAEQERKDLGAWYTPPELCRFLAERTCKGRRKRLTICDPMAGAGAFLQAAADATNGTALLYGVDIDPLALRTARRLIGISAARLKLGNALVSPLRADERDWLARTHPEFLARLVQAGRAGGVSPRCRQTARRILQTLIQDRLHPLLGERESDFLPFCWELEFPEIFFTRAGELRTDAGFDVVLGNPPWNNLRPDDREFFTRFDSSFRARATRAERDTRKHELLRSSRVNHKYSDYCEHFRYWNAYIRSGRFYHHQGGPANGHRAYKIEHNLYKLALERAWELAKPGGMIGLIVPAGFLGDLGATQLRKLYFDGGACHGLWSFREDAGVFDATQGFVVIVFEKGGAARSFEYQSGMSAVEELFTAKPQAALLTVPLLRRTAPMTYAVPALHGGRDLAILEKLYRHPPLGKITPGDPWVARPARDLHTRDDRDLLRAHDTGIPALKGDSIEAFALRRPFERWVDAKSYESRGKDFHTTRVAWRAIANVHLAHRLQAALIPPRHALLNSLNYFIPDQPEPVKYYLLALLNSSVLEWRVRQLAKNNNINQYVIASLSVPRLMPGDKRFDRIVALSRKLVALGKRAAGFSPAELRAELEEQVALLYGLNAAERRNIAKATEPGA